MKKRIVPKSATKRRRVKKVDSKSMEFFKRTCLSFRAFLSASFFILLTFAVFIEAIPFIITSINNSIIEQENVSEFHFSTIKTFFSEKFGAVKSSAKILKDDWDSRRLVYSDLIQNGTVGHDSKIWKFFSHLYHFNNTFCSIFFSNFTDQIWPSSTYVGFDKIECGDAFCYRYWLQTESGTHLTVYNMNVDNSVDTNYGYKIDVSDINKSLANFTVYTRSYFSSSIDKPNGVYGAPYGSAAGHVSLYYAIPIKPEAGTDPDRDGEYVGVIKNNLSLEMVTSYLTSIINNGLVVVAEKNGNIVGSSDVAKIPYQYNDDEASTWYLVVDTKKFRLNIKDFVGDAGIRQVLSKIQFSDSAVPTKATFYNTQYILSVSPYNHDDLEWNILYFRSTWDVYGSLVISICVIIVVSMIISLVAAAVGYFLISFFVNYPLNILIRQMKEVEDFNFTFLEMRKKSFIYEVAELQKKFFFFAKALKKLISYLPAYVKEEKRIRGVDSQNSFISAKSGKKSGSQSDSSSVNDGDVSDSESLTSVNTVTIERESEYRPVAVVYIAINSSKDESSMGSQKNFVDRFRKLLETVEKNVEECKGSILGFGEKFITIGFNTFSIQTLNEGYQVMAGKFCFQMSKWFFEHKDEFIDYFTLHFGITVDGEAEVRIFGTANNKTREVAGNVTTRAKLLTDVLKYEDDLERNNSDVDIVEDMSDSKKVKNDLKYKPKIAIDYESAVVFPPNFLFRPIIFAVFPQISNKLYPVMLLQDEMKIENMEVEWTIEENEKDNMGGKRGSAESKNDFQVLKRVLNGEMKILEYKGKCSALRSMKEVMMLYDKCERIDDLYRKFRESFEKKLRNESKSSYVFCVDVCSFMKKLED